MIFYRTIDNNNNFLLMSGVFLMLAVIALYWPVSTFDFIFFNNSKYILNNQYVRMGLTVKNVKWAFSAMHCGNWHPLTWLSHMLDVEIFGVEPGRHHMTNVFFHMMNTLLLLTLLMRLTQDKWPSFYVAALFAVHPLHIESVAWISERKDVLSAFFWLITFLFYFQYIQKKTILRYLLTLLMFVFGLMSKPMLVTLPFTLLLFDCWPLSRIDINKFDRKKIICLMYEKIPFFIFTSVSCVITVIAQNASGAITDTKAYPLFLRIGNVFNDYALYLWKTILPLQLSIYYPFKKTAPLESILFSFFILSLTTFFALRFRKQKPFLIVGWLWFLGTLLPVIGIIKVGTQSIADRYTYIPHIGLFIAFVWGVKSFKYRHGKYIFHGLMCFFLIILIPRSWEQVRVWKDDITLFGNSVKYFPKSSLAHIYYANAFVAKGDFNNAIINLKKALLLDKGNTGALYNLGLAYRDKGEVKEAQKIFEEIAKKNPNYTSVYYELGELYAIEKKFKKSIENYNILISKNPLDSKALSSIGVVYYLQGNNKKAIDSLRKATDISPDNVLNHYRLGLALAKTGMTEEAIIQFQKIISLSPDHKKAKMQIRLLQQKMKKRAEYNGQE